MALTRSNTWDTRELPQFIAARRGAAFAWGTVDCCLTPADAIAAITGTDIADDFRGKYSDEASAFALVRAVTGGSSVADAAAWCAAKHGLPEWTYPLQARRGDLVVVKDGAQLIAGFVGLDGKFAISSGPDGLKYLPLRQAIRAWKV